MSLNNYESVPEFLYHDKIHATLEDNVLGDAAKFLHVAEQDGYVLVCDDDLIYPPDYVEYMCDKVDEHNCPVSLLGKVYTDRPIKSFRTGYTELHRCLGEVDNDYLCDVIGTGAMAYHTDHIEVDISDFKMRNMADIWMALLAHEQGVRLVAVQHTKGYVKHVTYEDRIWAGTVDDSVQTMILNSFLK